MLFRSLLGNWLRNAARQKIREQVVQTAREKLSEAAEGPHAEESADHDQRCDVGVVFALGVEAGGLEDLLEHVVRIRGDGFVVRRGLLKGRKVIVIQSGPGRAAAARATRTLLSGHQPQWIISAGFAGGLSPQVKRHDLLMADSLADITGHRLTIDLKIDPAALAQTPGVHVGRLLTVDRIIRLPQEKRTLGQEHQALAVDMESFAVAQACREAEVRLLAIRIISDAVDDQLAADVQRLLEQGTPAAKLGAVIGTVWNRPSSVKDMFKLRENALLASDRLAKFLTSTIEQLVPLPPACRAGP